MAQDFGGTEREAEIPKFYLSTTRITGERGGRRDRKFVIPYCGLGLEHLEHSFPARQAALEHVGDPTERDHRPGEHRQICKKCDELTDGHAPADHLAAA